MSELHHSIPGLRQSHSAIQPKNAAVDLAKLPLPQLEKKLGSTPDGLAQAEVEQRQARYGFNEITEKQASPVLKFLKNFWGPLPWMIEVAALLSLIVKHWSDFAIILTLLIVNGVVGFVEEYQAGNAIKALKAKLSPTARALRDGEWQTIPARELVPGDVIHIRLGDIIPADMRLLDGGTLEVDQSALTGESLPVSAKTGDVLYSGSILKRGEANGMVYATGEATFFGRTASLVTGTGPVSHFQKAVLKIGDYLIVLAVVLVVLILFVALFRGDPFLTTLQFALVLVVAAIPVAMPTVLSVTMAVGARLLAKKEAVVSKLTSIEELAGVDVLCTDKTGTLTQNKLTLGDPFLCDGVKVEAVLRAASLASRAESQDAIDLAVLDGSKKAGVQLDGFTVQDFQPFDPVSKLSEAQVKQDGRSFKACKGAPQVILGMSANQKAVGAAVNAAIDDFAQRGYRSLGVAQTDEHGDWQFLGILPLFDPPRPDSKSTLAKAEAMGLEVKMVTGDQLAIAKDIASQLDLGTNILDASVFGDTPQHQVAQLGEKIEAADGFAQVYPEHKYHIVDVLQKRGHIVGMTGDGVNDAPALGKADAGVAVFGATDAARSAADIVLLTPGLSVIVDAINESRKIFKRMNSYAIYRIAETVRVLLFMTLSILVFNFYPLTAAMIVLLALLNDGAILAIAYDHVKQSAKPERWNMPVVLGIATVLGIAGLVASFGLFYLAERVFHLNQNVVQTLMYLKLSVAGHLTIFLTRTKGPFWSSRPAPVLVAAVGITQSVATLLAVYGILMPAIGWMWALFVWGYALIWFLVNDRIKLLAYQVFDNRMPGLLRARQHLS
jgi:H+-transporting ATPase